MPQIINIPINRLFPHPDNPRKDLGDLSELSASIKASGILQNLTVVPDEPDTPDTDYTIIIGHRRYAAAKIAGLTELPCGGRFQEVRVGPMYILTSDGKSIVDSRLVLTRSKNGVRNMDKGYWAIDHFVHRGCRCRNVRRR